MIKFKIDKAVLVLTVLILIRLITAPYPFDNTIPESPDHQTYLHMIQMIKDHGFVSWDQYWYGGVPFLKFYPPLSFVFAALLPFNDLISYKLLLLIFWAIAPIAAYLMFKELDLTIDQTLVATSVFSLATFFAVRFSFVQAPTFVAIPIALMFLIHFFRLMKERKSIDLALSAIFLGCTVLTHLIPAVLVVLISMIYVLTNYVGRYKSAIYCYGLAFLMSSFWSVPFLLEQKYADMTNDGIPLTLISPLKFLYSNFGYYFNYFGIIATLVVLAFIVIYLKKHKPDKFVIWTLIALFINYLASYEQFGERMLLFVSLPIALIFASLYKNYRTLVLGFIAIQGILFIVYLYPITASVPIDELQIAQFLTGKEGRVNVISPYDAFAGYTFPKYGISISYGSNGQSISKERLAFLENTLRLNLECKKSLGLFELLSNLDLLSKKTASADSKCSFDTENVSENFGRAFIKHVVVSNKYPDVISFFNSNSNFSIELINNKYTVYNFLGKSEFVSPKTIYARTADTITIFEVTSGTISESWYPYWEADGYTIGKDQYGFMTFAGSGPLNLVYKEPEYYKLFDYLSLAALIFTVTSLQRRTKPSRISLQTAIFPRKSRKRYKE